MIFSKTSDNRTSSKFLLNLYLYQKPLVLLQRYFLLVDFQGYIYIYTIIGHSHIAIAMYMGICVHNAPAIIEVNSDNFVTGHFPDIWFLGLIKCHLIIMCGIPCAPIYFNLKSLFYFGWLLHVYFGMTSLRSVCGNE